MRNKRFPLVVAVSCVLPGAACTVGESAEPTEGPAVVETSSQLSQLTNCAPFPNASGDAATFSSSGSVALTGAFFTSFGTNDRTCATCHQPGDGWTITPAHVTDRFNATGGTDPIFRPVDGANAPNADFSTETSRRKAYSMLLNKGLIRVGIGIPGAAEFELAAVEDPYGFAKASQLSLFRRPLPSANLMFLSTVMWDGRETLVDTAHHAAQTSNCLQPPFPSTCFLPVDPNDLVDQALGATLGHAQAMVGALSASQQQAIVDFETSLTFGQIRDATAGNLDARGALGGPINIAQTAAYFGINDNFGDYRTHAAFTPVIFRSFDAWANGGTSTTATACGVSSATATSPAAVAARKAIARGQALFNSKPITISGVKGLNGSLGLPASFTGTCGTCHDALEAGNHSVPAPLDIGVSDGSRRSNDMPLYTLRCTAAGVSAGHCTVGQTIKTTDPGRALITGQWNDIGKFKGPVLRGLAARAPYFHNGSAVDLNAVLVFYTSRFGVTFTPQERSDLLAFLTSL